jgi:CubicO group peptidase (beta-lactamase class C family)
MKRHLFLTLLLLTSCSVFCQDLSLRIDTLGNAYAKAMAFSGSVLVADHGEVLSNKGYGFKNISAKTMNDSNTVYKPLDFSPGTKYSYSNSGYILLGYIIEKVTGRPYFQVVHENIFGPLHMTHSGFDFKGLTSTDKATGYTNPSAGLKAEIVDSSVSLSAGAIYTTTGDLYQPSMAAPGKIAADINALLHGQPYSIPHQRVAITVDTNTLKQYVGAYQLNPNLTVTMTLENGQLMTQITNQPKFPLFAEKENFFFLKVVDAQIEFVKGADGTVEKVILYQNGRQQAANKIK